MVKCEYCKEAIDLSKGFTMVVVTLPHRTKRTEYEYFCGNPCLVKYNHYWWDVKDSQIVSIIHHSILNHLTHRGEKECAYCKRKSENTVKIIEIENKEGVKHKEVRISLNMKGEENLDELFRIEVWLSNHGLEFAGIGYDVRERRRDWIIRVPEGDQE